MLLQSKQANVFDTENSVEKVNLQETLNCVGCLEKNRVAGSKWHTSSYQNAR